MKKINISIIVPVYNVEQYLEKCLESLVHQTYKNVEIILVNDGSTDNSRKIISKYEKKYNNIICIDKENGGQGSARNLGIKEAKGDYITFVDSDDWISTNMCELMIEKALKNNSDLVFANFSTVKNEVIELGDVYGNKETDNVKKYLLTQSGPCHKLIKKDIIVDNNLYFPEIRAYEDINVVPLWGLKAKNISYIEDSVYFYLIREGSTMKQQKFNTKLEAIFYSMENMLKQYKIIDKDLVYIKEIEWLFIEHLLHGASLRFFKFENHEKYLNKINKIMKENFPNWNKNFYYKNQTFKYKLVCTMFYKKMYSILKFCLK